MQAAQTGGSFIQSRPLRSVLVTSNELVESVAAALRAAATITQLGIEILDVAIAALKPDPEMTKAVQAQAREQLLREADRAIYERRNASVELERTIRENELNTEIAVAQKRQQVRETEMQAEIVVEQKRSALVESRIKNGARKRKLAEWHCGRFSIPCAMSIGTRSSPCRARSGRKPSFRPLLSSLRKTPSGSAS